MAVRDRRLGATNAEEKRGEKQENGGQGEGGTTAVPVPSPRRDRRGDRRGGGWRDVAGADGRHAESTKNPTHGGAPGVSERVRISWPSWLYLFSYVRTRWDLWPIAAHCGERAESPREDAGATTEPRRLSPFTAGTRVDHVTAGSAMGRTRVRHPASA
ncbi:hypothetical protein GCM10023196_041290 [Actinoallomurus vinaceus]|uniref:Pr1-like protein n=1 Tax=Actinoallomurus vinaceus TaxID=1080074 RepID=A0ABP8UC65_9ACTN